MSVDYYQYLQSPEWARLRELKLKQADGRCQLCNSNKALHVHHRTYERLGRERLVDLTVLCADCHAKFHDKALTGTKPKPKKKAVPKDIASMLVRVIEYKGQYQEGDALPAEVYASQLRARPDWPKKFKTREAFISWCAPQGKHESARASSLWATAVGTSRKRAGFNALLDANFFPDDVTLTWMPGNTIEVQTGRTVDIGKLSRIVKDHLGVWPWIVKAGEQFHPSWANGHDDIIADHAARLQEAL